MPSRVLIVEDDRAVAALVRTHLERAGFECDTVASGSAALLVIREAAPDLVLLDLELPGLEGLEVCKRLRQDPGTSRLPIIILTARSDEIDRVLGLEAGADDYVAKPFSSRELVGRVKAVLRRSLPSVEPPVARLGALEVDEARHAVRVAGAAVSLTASEFGLLSALIRARGRVLSRSVLLAALPRGAGPTPTGRTVDFHVSRLRAKLGAEAYRIVTVRGFGYRLDQGG